MRTKTAGPKVARTRKRTTPPSPEFLSHRLSEATSSIREMEAKTGQVAPVHMYAYLFSVEDAIKQADAK